jgi:hypothetical protein
VTDSESEGFRTMARLNQKLHRSINLQVVELLERGPVTGQFAPTPRAAWWRRAWSATRYAVGRWLRKAAHVLDGQRGDEW